MVACLDGAPVTAAEVTPHLRPDVDDPRRAALDAALRVRLFADEAARRGLAAPDGATGAKRRAVLHQALIRDEAARRGAVPDAIGEEEARAYYEANLGRFNKITGVWVRAIFADDRDRAEALRGQVEGAGDEAFPEDLGEAHQDGVDPALTRAANDLRAEGAIVGPVATSDGRWAILRATRIELEAKPWDEAMARTVKNHLAHDREAAALDALYAELARSRRVEVFDAALAALSDGG